MNLKKYTPFIIPSISLILVLFLAFRWYNLRTQRNADLEINNVEIQNLSPEEAEIVIGNQDANTVELQPQEEESMIAGQLRYYQTDDSVFFTVMAELPLDEAANYQVWLSPKDKDNFQKGFMLSYGKGGYTGSASVSLDQLPLELVVSKESNNDDAMEEQLLKGVLEESELQLN